jgi:excisionase family DNA binding protein
MPVPENSGEYLGLNAACRRYGLAYSTTRAKIASGELPAYRFGRRVFLRPADIEALFQPIQGEQ